MKSRVASFADRSRLTWRLTPRPPRKNNGMITHSAWRTSCSSPICSSADLTVKAIMYIGARAHRGRTVRCRSPVVFMSRVGYDSDAAWYPVLALEGLA